MDTLTCGQGYAADTSAETKAFYVQGLSTRVSAEHPGWTMANFKECKDRHVEALITFVRLQE